VSVVDEIAYKFPPFPFPPHAIGLFVVGSESHGTKIAPAAGGVDDTDYMGIVIPPERHVLGLHEWEHWVYQPDEKGLDVVVYSLRKYIGLLLKGNPNVMGTLWLRPEFYTMRTPALDAIVAERDIFSSQQAYASFIGYAHSQLKCMTNMAFKGYMGKKRKQLVEQHGFDTKNAAHLIRLLRMGIEFIETGKVNVYRENDREELMSIKRGEWGLAKVQMAADDLFATARRSLAQSPLPIHPDAERAERLLIRLTKDALGYASR
jgi:predicted nucleotidyltransferase